MGRRVVQMRCRPFPRIFRLRLIHSRDRLRGPDFSLWQWFAFAPFELIENCPGNCPELEDPWAVIRICSAVSVSEPIKILRHAYTLNAIALMSPESYQQMRPPDPPSPQFLRPVLILDPLRLNRLRTIPRVGEGTALILPEVSSARFARWREGTFPHSNELNTERRSKDAKADPHQLMPTVPASTPDARRSWDGSMTLPDDATAQTSLFNRGHAQELLRD